MLAIVITLVRFYMLIAVLIGAALFGGLAIDRRKSLDGRPVAPFLNLAAFIITISPLAIVEAMRLAHASPRAFGTLPMITVGAAGLGSMLLAASIGRLVRRTIKGEKPRPRWARLDSAMGMLAVTAPITLAAILIGSLTSATAFRIAVAIATAVPISTAIAGIYLSLATRPGRPGERVRRRDVALAVVGALILSHQQIAAVAYAASQGLLLQPLIPIFAVATFAIVVLDEFRRRRAVGRG